MREALTMIELVFIITIIGVLAGVAILKLSSARIDGNITVEMVVSENIECPHDAYRSVKKPASDNLLTSTRNSKVHRCGGSKIKR